MYLKHIIHGVIRGLNPVKSNWPIFLILSSLTKNLMGGGKCLIIRNIQAVSPVVSSYPLVA